MIAFTQVPNLNEYPKHSYSIQTQPVERLEVMPLCYTYTITGEAALPSKQPLVSPDVEVEVPYVSLAEINVFATPMRVKRKKIKFVKVVYSPKIDLGIDLDDL